MLSVKRAQPGGGASAALYRTQARSWLLASYCGMSRPSGGWVYWAERRKVCTLRSAGSVGGGICALNWGERYF
jgi:hypothetical protein